MKIYIASLLCFLALVSTAFAVEKRTRIPVYVTPYYQSSPSPEEAPEVRVGSKFDKLLSSSDPKDILKVRDLIEQDPLYVSPMSLMVLAIRLYDTGSRDEAVFWFYVAKDRYILLHHVIDMRSSAVAGVAEAMHSFHTLVGPFINSYAFCDIESQVRIRARALEWTRQHPYKQILFWEKFPAREGGRAKNLSDAIAMLEAGAKSEAEEFRNPDFVADFRRQRAENDVDAEFCWESE